MTARNYATVSRQPVLCGRTPLRMRDTVLQQPCRWLSCQGNAIAFHVLAGTSGMPAGAIRRSGRHTSNHVRTGVVRRNRYVHKLLAGTHRNRPGAPLACIGRIFCHGDTQVKNRRITTKARSHEGNRDTKSGHAIYRDGGGRFCLNGAQKLPLPFFCFSSCLRVFVSSWLTLFEKSFASRLPESFYCI